MKKNKDALARARESIRKLEALWPTPLNPAVKELFSILKETLKGTSVTAEKFDFFDLMDQLRHLFVDNDVLFLSRQVTHQLDAPEILPPVFGVKEKIQEALHGILQKAVPMIPRKSILRIEFKTIQVREGKMVEARFFIPSLYDEGGSLQKISDLLKCRPGIHSCFGQLWIEFLKEKQWVISVRLPAFETTSLKGNGTSVTYKYDISFEGFSLLRQRFGIDRSGDLVTQVQNFVRTLVRHPVDMVLAFPEQGQVTVIYESNLHGGDSLKTRISQRLKKEIFRVGKRQRVNPKFHYTLSVLE